MQVEKKRVKTALVTASGVGILNRLRRVRVKKIALPSPYSRIVLSKVKSYIKVRKLGTLCSLLVFKSLFWQH